MKGYILVLIFQAISLVYTNFICSKEHFAVIFDARSKGTRMFVYQFRISAFRNFTQVKLNLEDSIEQKLYCELDGYFQAIIKIFLILKNLNLRWWLRIIHQCKPNKFLFCRMHGTS